MTDGAFDFALLVYDSEEVREAWAAGPAPRIHHWGFAVDDRKRFAERIAKHGGTIFSKPEGTAIKFRAQDGTYGVIR
jgi:hypothetical protein